jgi:CubicO group peptidase (beta-lactamase class C family)
MIRKLATALVGVSALIGLFFLALPRQEITSDKTEEFDDFISALIKENAIPGVAIAIINGRKLQQIKGYGFADIETGRKMTGDTPINIASVSKPILGIALLQLSERDMLDMDEDINVYLPFAVDNPHFGDEKITIRDLATHTSGIADYYDANDFTPGIDAPTPLVDHLSGLLTVNGSRYQHGEHYLKSLPGEKREYSNLGAGVAGAVAEAVSGKSLNALTQEGVFKPLSMKQTSWLLKDFPDGQLAIRYDVEQCIAWTGICADTESPVANYLISKVFNPPADFKRLKAYPQYGNPNYPDGGVHSSASDLAKLAMSILDNGAYKGGALLQQSSFEDMLRLQLPRQLSERQRFFWRDKDGMTGHSGSDLGIYSSFYFDREAGDAVIILMNRTPDAKTEEAMRQIMGRIRKGLLAS